MPDAARRGVRRLRAGSDERPVDDGDVNDDDEARRAAALDAAATWRPVVVLKGARTIIAAPMGRRHRAVEPSPATGGTGDVLAGPTMRLLAQGLDPFAAARLGVYLHGLSGDAAEPVRRLGTARVRTCPTASRRPQAPVDGGGAKDREKRLDFGAVVPPTCR